MNNSPTPNKGQTKRRGLALPPRGQALSRLQDLEQETEQQGIGQNDAPLPAAEDIGALNAASDAVNHDGSNAVRTASSNAVSDAVNHDGDNDVSSEEAPAKKTPSVKTTGTSHHENRNQAAGRTGSASSQKAKPALIAVAQAVREPTTRITVDMPDSLHRKIAILSVETRRSIKDLVIDALMVSYFNADADGADN